MMGDYIKRGDALDICQREYEERLRMEDYCGDTVAWNIGGAIKKLPAADVEEAKHGKWERIPLNMDPTYFAHRCNLRKRCSSCRYAMPDEYPNFARCPNCGAKMDLEG